jgi:hypothetical protein
MAAHRLRCDSPGAGWPGRAWRSRAGTVRVDGRWLADDPRDVASPLPAVVARRPARSLARGERFGGGIPLEVTRMEETGWG